VPLEIGEIGSILLRESKDSRATIDRVWDQQLKWFMGDQELEGVMPGELNTVTNLIFSRLRTIIAILSNNVPEISVKHVNSQMGAVSDAVTLQLQRILQRNDFQSQLVQFVSYMELFGRGFIKPTWNQRMRRGFGDIRIEVPDTRHIYLEPGKVHLRDMNYIFEARPVNKLTLYRMYPDRKKDIDDLFKKIAEKQIDDASTKYGDETGRRVTAPDEAKSTASVSYVEDVAMGKRSDRAAVEFCDWWFADERSVGDLRGAFNETGDRKSVV